MQKEYIYIYIYIYIGDKVKIINCNRKLCPFHIETHALVLDTSINGNWLLLGYLQNDKVYPTYRELINLIVDNEYSI